MSDSPQNASQQNPLDMLEELLKKAQSDGAGGAKGVAANPDEEVAKKESDRQAFEQELLEAEEASKQQAAQHLQNLYQEVGQTPEQQARQQQQQELQKQKEEEDQARHGHVIRQLGHTKVPDVK